MLSKLRKRLPTLAWIYNLSPKSSIGLALVKAVVSQLVVFINYFAMHTYIYIYKAIMLITYI